MSAKGKRVEEIHWAREVLGLPERASFAEIRDAYHRHCQSAHPDRQAPDAQGKATERMKQINRAYTILEDYFQHYRLDLTGEAVEQAGFDAEAWWRERFAGSFWQNE